MKRFIFPILMVCLLSAGCASTPENLQRETARVIGDISPEQVQVSNVKRGVDLAAFPATKTESAPDISNYSNTVLQES